MKRATFATVLLIAVMVTATQVGCSKNSGSDPPPPVEPACVGVAATFAASVAPLISTSCASGSGCHGAGSSNSGGPLINFAQIKAKSAIIKSQVSSGAMPLGGTLTAAQKATIICWVNGGAPNN